MRMALTENIDNFNYKKTKKKVNKYFEDLDRLEWEKARLNVQKGLIARCDVTKEEKKQPYIPVGKDEFSLIAKAAKNEEVKKHLSGYFWAKSILTEEEQIYIMESFVNGRYQEEIADLLGFNSSDSWAFRKLKRRAIYKFAYVLNLIV